MLPKLMPATARRRMRITTKLAIIFVPIFRLLNIFMSSPLCTLIHDDIPVSDDFPGVQDNRMVRRDTPKVLRANSGDSRRHVPDRIHRDSPYPQQIISQDSEPVSYTHLRAHETRH